MASETILVLYIPGLHNGYIKLLEKYRGAKLYILGKELVQKFPKLKLEIRAIEPEIVRKMIEGTGIMGSVEIAEHETLTKLSTREQTTIILSNESISDDIYREYFQSALHILRESVFLRFDEKEVQKTYGEAPYDTTTTSKELYRTIALKTDKEAQKSSDWFRRVGAALFRENPYQLLYIAHNERMPSPHEPWLVGDPRMYIEYGTNSNLSAALHAEQAVVARAASDGVSTKNASILVTTYPCPACTNILIAAEIKRVYFVEGYAAIRANETLKAHNIEVVRVIPE